MTLKLLRAALIFFAFSILSSGLKTEGAEAHPHHGPHTEDSDPFRQLDETWPTPNELRLGSGAPGPAYWQQKVDYHIDVKLDDERKELSGDALITYHNRSPHSLSYLWVQLDQNRYAPGSTAHLTRTFKGKDHLHYGALKSAANLRARPPGFVLSEVSTAQGKPLSYQIIDTMMRVDLPLPLRPQEITKLRVKWSYPILRHRDVWARAGYEDLKPLIEVDKKRRDLVVKLGKAGSLLPIGGEGKRPLAGPALEASSSAQSVQRRIYEIAQWYPRLAAYTDVHGWQNKQFLGQGEFTLEFGDYVVNITAPDTFVVAATGELINAREVLSKRQRARLRRAKKSAEPLYVITPEEARERSARAPRGVRRWVFSATNVRDFAFAASNAYLWDAAGYRTAEDEEVLVMSLYPPEAAALWSRYSTHAVLHTLENYERFAFSYPYPVALSVNGPVFGMEYPMISFNGVRPELDDTYSKSAKYSLISVIIHEVGHFFFPMIVNSDERRWTWLDEGINSFLQYQAERSWEEKFPHWHGEPDLIVPYMTGKDHQPIMTHSDSLVNMGSNAYDKASSALSILRETVIGPKLFDEAMRAYAQRWRFKRPTPFDFFRTMEDVSGVDLDWFWRGWFYGTQYVDITVSDVRRLRLKRHQPSRDKAVDQAREDRRAPHIAIVRDEGRPVRVERYPSLLDFYNSYDPHQVTPMDEKDAKSKREKIGEADPERLEELESKRVFYELTLTNKGGLVMPIPLRLIFADGSQEERRIPAELWRKNAREVTLFLDVKAPLKAVLVDPHREIADAHRGDNRFPQEISDVDSFELKPWRSAARPNPLQRQLRYDAKQEGALVNHTKQSEVNKSKE